MGEVDAADPTELAPSENETASVYAWGLDVTSDDDELPTSRITPGRITGAAVAVSVVAIAAAGLIAWQHLRTVETPAAATTSMVPAAPMTTTVVPVAAPPATSAPPPVTITTVVVQAPAPTKVPANQADVRPTNPRIPPQDMEMYDRRLVALMQASNWRIDDPELMVTRAHQVCSEFAMGTSVEGVRQKIVALGLSPAEAVSFTSNVMQTYPECP